MRRLFNGARQVVETVNSQLTEQFHLEVNHAQSFWGMTARLHTKLAAHTLCLYLNRCLGKPDVLQIKHLVFPDLAHRPRSVIVLRLPWWLNGISRVT